MQLSARYLHLRQSQVPQPAQEMFATNWYTTMTALNNNLSAYGESILGTTCHNCDQIRVALRFRVVRGNPEASAFVSRWNGISVCPFLLKELHMAAPVFFSDVHPIYLCPFNIPETPISGRIY